MIPGHSWIKPGCTPDEYIDLCRLAKLDNHGVIVPTHLIQKDGATIGYYSIGIPGKPVVMGWMSTKELAARESFSLLNRVENHVAMNGGNGLILPIPLSSPFHPVMKSMGYVNAGTYDFFVKDL